MSVPLVASLLFLLAKLILGLINGVPWMFIFCVLFSINKLKPGPNAPPSKCECCDYAKCSLMMILSLVILGGLSHLFFWMTFCKRHLALPLSFIFAIIYLVLLIINFSPSCAGFLQLVMPCSCKYHEEVSDESCADKRSNCLMRRIRVYGQFILQDTPVQPEPCIWVLRQFCGLDFCLVWH
jgi:hypothetical protein